MNADIVLNGTTLELVGNVVNKNAQTEILVGGPLGGYAFQDRKNPAVRYVLYADNGAIRLWKDGQGDVFVISDDPKSRFVPAGIVSATLMDAERTETKSLVIKYKEKDQRIVIGKEGPKENMIDKQMDVLKTILEVQEKILALENRI